ncbi:hypothetical protein QBC32DRAFT_55525 [Pseudoneurospora amorphoporcata]|uniref:Uncharacterized protein n=1 Tax=Pseudoneurospora amorphoporcata TaxID=241081 RepID=A0AAN6P5J2_9PEZI|nr:hypothetical protein QBC32DRAFT_55525 [Pseudoneurospora amorphoporcata]
MSSPYLYTLSSTAIANERTGHGDLRKFVKRQARCSYLLLALGQKYRRARSLRGIGKLSHQLNLNSTRRSHEGRLGFFATSRGLQRATCIPAWTYGGYDGCIGMCKHAGLWHSEGALHPKHPSVMQSRLGLACFPPPTQQTSNRVPYFPILCYLFSQAGLKHFHTELSATRQCTTKVCSLYSVYFSSVPWRPFTGFPIHQHSLAVSLGCLGFRFSSSLTTTKSLLFFCRQHSRNGRMTDGSRTKLRRS